MMGASYSQQDVPIFLLVVRNSLQVTRSFFSVFCLFTFPQNTVKQYAVYQNYIGRSVSMDILQLLVLLSSQQCLLCQQGKSHFPNTLNQFTSVYSVWLILKHIFTNLMTIRILISSCCFFSCVCILNLLNGSVDVVSLYCKL